MLRLILFARGQFSPGCEKLKTPSTCAKGAGLRQGFESVAWPLIGAIWKIRRSSQPFNFRF
jgi:hypothetical protein